MSFRIAHLILLQHCQEDHDRHGPESHHVQSCGPRKGGIATGIA